MKTFTKQLPINTTIFALLILLFSSCSKQNRTVIEGHVYEYGTDKPIPNAKIEFTEFVASMDLGSQGFTLFLDSIFTDEDGYYKFKHEGDTDGIFFRVSKPNYFEINSEFGNDYSTFFNGGKHVQDIELDAHAYLKFLLYDVNYIDNSFIAMVPQFVNGNEYYFNENAELTGIIRGNNYHKYHYQINDIIYKDSILIEPFETDTIIINF